MSPMLVLATHNDAKLREFREILRSDARLASLPDDGVVSAAELGLPAPAETGTTFEENALIKARSVAAATGLPTVADDSGLAVDVLGGAPGVFSARWCGRHGDDQANLALLLAQLSEVPPEHRGAAFVCVAALVAPDGSWHVRTGEMRGHLLTEPRGTGGFGYDPIFLPAGRGPDAAGRDGSAEPVAPLSQTTAQLPPEVKNRISHRGKALRGLIPEIANALLAAEEGPG